MLYADASALAKLFLREQESAALVTVVTDQVVVTSVISSVEVARAIRVAGAETDIEWTIDDVLAGCTVIDVDADVVRSAAALAGPGLRSLDALHLASALRADADTMLVYDRQLARAATAAGLRVEAPGAD